MIDGVLVSSNKINKYFILINYVNDDLHDCAESTWVYYDIMTRVVSSYTTYFVVKLDL